jgi:RNA polymerase sigma-70 factor, ECF subfamily
LCGLILLAARGTLGNTGYRYSLENDMFPTANSDQHKPLSHDTELVARARARDTTAFRELVSRHEPQMRYLVARFIDGPADREEVIQNALLAAWRHLPEFEGRSQFGSWLHRVTTNNALMLLRHQRRRHDTSVGDIEAWSRSQGGPGSEYHCGVGSCWIQRPDEAMQRAELRALLERKVADLPQRLRDVFVLRYVDGLSVRETGRMLRLSDAAVKTRLHRACQALRKAIHRSASDIAICRVTKA